MITLIQTGGVALTNCIMIADEAAGQAVLFRCTEISEVGV